MPRWLIALCSAALTASLGVVLLVGTNLINRPAGTRAPAAGSSSQPPTASPPEATAYEQPATPADPTPPGRAAARPGTAPRYVFPVAGCKVGYSRSHHDYPAADLFTHSGCRFVSPADGRVDEVYRTDRWNPKTNRGADRGGIAVSVIGIDGVRYYGAHLSSVAPAIRPGLRVRAGQELGRTGNTGSARPTPPHLHFGISWPTPPGHWWIRRGAISPQTFLDAWQTGHPTSPAATVRSAKATYGSDTTCKSYC